MEADVKVITARGPALKILVSTTTTAAAPDINQIATAMLVANHKYLDGVKSKNAATYLTDATDSDLGRALKKQQGLTKHPMCSYFLVYSFI